GRGGPGAGLALPPGLLGAQPSQPESTGYAPTYYPGVVSAGEAGKVAVGPGLEVAGIDIQIQLVPLATVTGIVAGVQDVANVMMVPDDAAGGRGGRLNGQILNGRAMAD